MAAASVTAALEELSSNVREAIVTAFFGGFTYRFVAVVLGEPEGTIKARIRNGLTQMRAVLERCEYSDAANQRPA